MSLFIKLTLGVAAVVIAFVVLGFVLKVLIFAAIVAALVAAGMFGVAAVRRRLGLGSHAMTYYGPR